jgi:hypothetical protein
MTEYLKEKLTEEVSDAHPDKGQKMAKKGAIKRTFQLSNYIEGLKTELSGSLTSVSKEESKVFQNVQKR